MFYPHKQKILPAVNSDEFLPPVSRWTSLAGIFLMINMGAALVVSYYLTYNVTVKSNATVRPGGDIRLVQPEIEGVVEKIFVKENQIVKKGDAIAQLDDAELNIQVNQIQGKIQDAKLQIVQVLAQLSAIDAQIAAEKQAIEKNIASAEADLQQNQRHLLDRRIKSRSEVRAARANLQKANAQLLQAQANLEFAKKDRDRLVELANRGAIGKRDYEQRELAVKQSELALKAEYEAVEIAKASLHSAEAELNPSNAPIQISQQNIARETAKGNSVLAALEREKKMLSRQQIELRNQISLLQQELHRQKLQRENTVIRASSDGVILKLNLRNTDQVVNPSQAIAEIVPSDTPLLIKARIPTGDIKKVEVGQPVQLRLDACPYPDYGTLDGVVKTIAPDSSTQLENHNGIPNGSYYAATIEPNQTQFGSQQRICKLQPGMTATADIISRQETPMQFLLRRVRLISDL